MQTGDEHHEVEEVRAASTPSPACRMRKVLACRMRKVRKRGQGSGEKQRRRLESRASLRAAEVLADARRREERVRLVRLEKVVDGDHPRVARVHRHL